MKMEATNVEITTRLSLNGRELSLLCNFLSYDSMRAYIESITPNSYEGGVSREEMINFVEHLKAISSSQRNKINEHVKKFGVVD